MRVKIQGGGYVLQGTWTPPEVQMCTTKYINSTSLRTTRYINSTSGTDVPMEFMYFVFTRMPGESYRRWLRSLLLCLCDVFRALMNSLVCWFYTDALGLVLFQIIAQKIPPSMIEVVLVVTIMTDKLLCCQTSTCDWMANCVLLWYWRLPGR